MPAMRRTYSRICERRAGGHIVCSDWEDEGLEPEEWPEIRVQVEPEDHVLYKRMLSQFEHKGKNQIDAFHLLLEAAEEYLDARGFWQDE